MTESRREVDVDKAGRGKEMGFLGSSKGCRDTTRYWWVKAQEVSGESPRDAITFKDMRLQRRRLKSSR